MSASDPKLYGKLLMDTNLAGRATHWHENLLAQAQNRPCSLHPYATSCVSSPVVADVSVCGTPCHPYSTQRSGRYSPESVESHKEFQVAMTDFMTWLTHMNPKAQVFEQVDGFFLPFDSKVSLETPFDRQDSKT